MSTSSSSCLEDEENMKGKKRDRGQEKRGGIDEIEEGKTESMECEEGEEDDYDYQGDELFNNAQIVGEDGEGEEDLLNKLWRTAGYGVAGESPPGFLPFPTDEAVVPSLGNKRPENFVKSSNTEGPPSDLPGDDLSVSTLGMEGWEENHEDLSPTTASQ